MTAPADDWIPTRESLLSRLRDWDDRESWEDFFTTYAKLIHNVARRSGLTEVEAQEVVQETVINVAKKMPSFTYDPARGSFKGWLLKTTQWRISDQFRRRRSNVSLDVDRVADGEVDPSGDGSEGPCPEALVVEAQWDDLWERNLLEVALERVKVRADPKEFQIFDLAVRRDWPPLKVARKLAVTRPRVYYAKYKISRMVRQEMAAVQRRTGPLTSKDGRD